MIYLKEAIRAAAAAMDAMPHPQVLQTYLPELLRPDVSNRCSTARSGSFLAAAFNFERGVHLSAAISWFQHHPLLMRADVLLASELDLGMARTQNLHTTKTLAEALGMNYVFGPEFLVTDAWENGNTAGLHGNAILSRFPLKKAKLVRLPIFYDWFYCPDEQRLGQRVAVLASIDVPGMGEVGLVSLHLENQTSPAQRWEQLSVALSAAEEHFGPIPLLLGGDVNTHTVDVGVPGAMEALENDPEEQWRRLGAVADFEPLFSSAAERGLEYRSCNRNAKATRRRLTASGRTMPLNLDWFFQRGLSCSGPDRVEGIFHQEALKDAPPECARYQGQEMSDHDIILVTCASPAAYAAAQTNK